jgi:energy-coupling factor transport system permease protein
MIALLGIMCGVRRFSFKMLALYALMIVIQILGDKYLPGVLKSIIVSFAMFIRKIFPCIMLGGILISTTRVGEFMAALNRIHLPRNILIPLTVMLRYLPMISEEWRAIKDAMRIRGVSPSFWGFLQQPADTIECIYVPLMMSASKIADELSAASVTRGIENPAPRTCLMQLSFRLKDLIAALCFTALLAAAIVI